MKTYTIRYTETYFRCYEVEATSEDEAKETLLQRLMDGQEHDPDICDSSFMEVTGIQ